MLFIYYNSLINEYFYQRGSIGSMKDKSLTAIKIKHQLLSLEQVGLIHSTSPAIAKFGELAEYSFNFIKSRFLGFSFFSNEKEAIKELKPYLEFANNRDINYMDVRRLRLQTPEGFKGNLYQYTKELADIVTTYYDSFVAEMIDPFDIYISKLINQPMLLDSLTYKHNVKQQDIDKYRKRLAKYFTGKGHGYLELSDIYDRLKDVDDIVRPATDIVKLSERERVKNVKQKVDELNEKINVLIEMLEDKTGNYNVKPKTLTTLSELVFQLAKQVEFYAVLNGMINGLIGALYDGGRVFERFMKGDKHDLAMEAYQYNVKETYSAEDLHQYLTTELPTLD